MGNTFRVINYDGDIEISIYKKANAVFKTNEYNETEDVCIYKETINIFDLLKENQELKKQLEEYKAINKVLSQELTKDKILKQDHLTTCCGISIVDIQKLITQQKEFIKYLEEKEKQFDGADPRLAGACSGILQKYKEIIGVSDEKK